MISQNSFSSLLETSDLVSYIGDRRVLNGISISCKAGQFTAIAGSNGVGKTTLLKSLSGILKPKSGTIFLNKKPISHYSLRERARTLAYLSQQGTISWPLPVKDVVALGRIPHGEIPEHLRQKGQKAVQDALQQVGLEGFEERIANALSGGERARVLLARALAVQSPILLADEPVAALDPLYQYMVLNILRHHAHQGCTIVAVLHDLNLILQFADQVILLKHGKVFSAGNPEVVFNKDNLAECFDVDTEMIVHKNKHTVLVHGPANRDKTNEHG